jgi:hypothetical protein
MTDVWAVAVRVANAAPGWCDGTGDWINVEVLAGSATEAMLVASQMACIPLVPWRRDWHPQITETVLSSASCEENDQHHEQDHNQNPDQTIHELSVR